MKNRTLLAIAASLMLATAGLPALATDAPKPLYERIGGLQGITVVVDDFIDHLIVNETLNKNPAIDAGRERSPAPYLKFQVSQLVHLNISEQEWGTMAGEFKKSLDRFKVPAAEQKELVRHRRQDQG